MSPLRKDQPTMKGYIKFRASLKERDRLRAASDVADCTITDFILASIRRQIETDKAQLEPDLHTGEHCQVQVINHLTPEEFQLLLDCATANQQSMSQYALKAALDDARAMVHGD